MLVNVLTLPAVRNDSAGGGRFLDSRGSRLHHGVDFLVVPRTPVFAPFDLYFTRWGIAYGSTKKYTFAEFQRGDFFLRYFYIGAERLRMSDAWRFGAHLKRGDAIGTVQDIAAHYPNSGMENHVHLEIFAKGEANVAIENYYYAKRNRTYVNPLEYLQNPNIEITYNV